jgi:cell division control protein 6
MRANLLSWDETLFKDPDVFEIDYIPDQFSFRESQFEELALQVKPGMRGGRPSNTICRGPPGTGKTTTIKMLFQKIRESGDTLVPIYVNCQIENTRFAVFSRIYQELFTGSIPKSGTSFKQIFDIIGKEVVRRGVVLLICLDDSNYLLYDNELNDLLYSLLRSHESFPGWRTGVICIVSDMAINIAHEVDNRVHSVFQPTEIYFPPYEKEEVHAILDMRVMQGFYPNVISGGLLDLVVKKVMHTGDLRVGIDLLKRAGDEAEHDARHAVLQEDIEKVYNISRDLHLSRTLSTLAPDERAVLEAVATRAQAKEDADIPVKVLAEIVESKPGIKYTRLHEILIKCDSMRLIDLHYREGRGRSRLVTLRYEPHQVLEGLKSPSPRNK